MQNAELTELRTRVNEWITDIHHTNIVETNDVINMLLDINFALTEIIANTPERVTA